LKFEPVNWGEIMPAERRGDSAGALNKPLNSDCESKIIELLKKGVRIPSPHSVEIGDEVDSDRISGENVVIHSGSRIFGSKTLILENTRLGYEGPVTIENCQIGSNVELKGGFFRGAVFLDKAQCGLGAHVREGTILEEQASIAHTVALKQTILFPFVTLGSLINFCDCLMAGGTSRKNHSEVGSSYIHFNFTPSQDKATASLIGDVARGVMLNQNPIFLGGQGGIVGPCRLGFGITVAAGTVVRKDETRSDRLIMGGAGKGGNVAFRPGRFRGDKSIVGNNIIYIANLIALRQWYDQVRSLFVSKRFPRALLEALQENVDLALEERIKRLEAVCQKKPAGVRQEPATKSLKLALELYEHWPELKEAFNRPPAGAAGGRLRDQFLSSIRQGISNFGPDYIRVIQGLDPADSAGGTRWLQGIIEDAMAESKKIIPSLF
jgi:UDP-N-acetylglucosamine/UDP-N-acetylgalactosamine diphosphorylase